MSLRKSTLIFILLQIIALFNAFIYQLKVNDIIKISLFIVSSLVIILISFLLAFLFSLNKKEEFKEYLMQYKKKTNFFVYVFAILIVFFLIPISFYVQSSFNFYFLEKIGFPLSVGTEELFKNELMGKNIYKALLIIYLAILVPIEEEIAFRSFLARGNRDLGTVTAIVLSSFIFSLFHAGPNQFFPQLFLATFILLIYFKTENIYIPMLMHITNNLITTCLILFVKEENLKSNTGINNNIIISIVAISFILLLVFYLLINYITTNKKVKDSNDYFVSQKRYLWNEGQYRRYSKKKGKKLDYLIAISLFVITFVLWFIRLINTFSQRFVG